MIIHLIKNMSKGEVWPKDKRVGRPHLTKEDIPLLFVKSYPPLRDGKMNVSELTQVCGVLRPTADKYMKIAR